MVSLATLLNRTDFVHDIEEESHKNPRCLWIPNASCAPAGVPDLSAWLTTHRSLDNLFRGGTALLKGYMNDVLGSGVGNTDAVAITLAIASWQLPQQEYPNGPGIPAGGLGHDQGGRKTLIGSASLNQNVGTGGGQVHAEHISTRVVVECLLDANKPVPNQYQWGHATNLSGVEFLVYAGKDNNHGGVQDFLPCPSCQTTVADAIKECGDTVASVVWQGPNIQL